MKRFEEEAKSFGARKTAPANEARQLAATSLLCGIDLAAAFTAPPETKAKLMQRLERVIERERLKGMRRHWSYDLNRHIALKQALDRLRGEAPAQSEDGGHVGNRARSHARKMKRRPKAPFDHAGNNSLAKP